MKKKTDRRKVVGVNQKKEEIYSHKTAVVFYIFLFSATIFWFLFFFPTRSVSLGLLLNDMDAFYTHLGFLEMISKNEWLAPGSNYVRGYGTFYFYLSAVVFFPFQLFQIYSEEISAFLALRAVNVFFSMASILVLYHLAKILNFPRVFLLFATVLTVFCEYFYYYSLSPKPDNVQFFFILVSLYFMKSFSISWSFKDLVSASISLSLAAAAKMAGFLMFPFFIAYVFTQTPGSWSKRTKYCLAAFTVFFSTYLFFNLRLILDFSHQVAYWTKTVSPNLWQDSGGKAFSLLWLTFPSYYGVGLYALTLAMLVVDSKNLLFRWKRVSAEQLFSFIFLGFLLILIFLIKKNQAVNYIMPLFPIMLVSSFRFLVLVAERVKIIKKPLVFYFFVFVLILTNAKQFSATARAMYYDINYFETLRVKAGLYLLENFNPETKILRFANWWVPEKFSNTVFFNRVSPTPEQILSMNPDLLLLTDFFSEDDPVWGQHFVLKSQIDSGIVPYRMIERFEDRHQGVFLVYLRNDIDKPSLPPS